MELTAEQIASIVTALEPKLTQMVNQAITPILEQMNPKDNDENDNSYQSDNPVAARVKELEKQLAEVRRAEAEKEKQASELRKATALSEALDKVPGLQYKGTVAKLLGIDLADATEQDGKWVAKSGKSLDELVDNYFKTDEGKHYLSPNHQDGTGTKSPSNKGTANDKKAVDMLWEAFN